MVKHTIDISEESNLKIKVLKSQHNLNTVSAVIENVLSETVVVVK